MKDRQQGPGTRAVHAGERQRPARDAAVVPIYQTAPFRFDSAEELVEGFAAPGLEGLYSRYTNPTIRTVEEKLAALEGADEAIAFASGMGALGATLSTLLGSGDRLWTAADIYGGTSSWLDWMRRRQPELAVDRIPLAELAERLEQGAPDDTRAVFLETPTNPLLSCCDIARVAAACARADLILVVDNTFATPVLQRPLELGAQIVVHSATKFLGGHDDVTAGVVAGDAATAARIREALRLGGAMLDPHAAFLLARGMRTLGLRVERQSASAERLASLLREHPAVEAVHYPLFDPIGRRQMAMGGGLVSFAVRGGWPAAARFLDRLEVFSIIPSLGGVDSGAISPAITSHRGLSPAERTALGIGDGLIRLSVGIEDPADLEADLLQALAG